ncbi:YesK-like family protein [Peribacillus deserti]|uniref:YesK-like family protein n=1 Tax=Peribacillus deserti TaxID=673318 RepID=UPI002153469D|nr:YesK-like family protein [Peribacillus deserti]
MFEWMFLIGLIIGLGFYALTYLFVKENVKKVVIVLIIGVLTILGSIFVIGGFEGMPFGVLGLGIITISILFSFFGKSLLWKKIVYTFLILFVALYGAFSYFNQVDYWIIKKAQPITGDHLDSYFQQLQNNAEIQGYKTFTILEGNKGVVLSLGSKMAGSNIEVLDVEEQGDTTLIKIRTFYNSSPEKNPVIAIGLNRLQPEIVIMDTNGTTYQQVK